LVLRKKAFLEIIHLLIDCSVPCKSAHSGIHSAKPVQASLKQIGMSDWASTPNCLQPVLRDNNHNVKKYFQDLLSQHFFLLSNQLK